MPPFAPFPSATRIQLRVHVYSQGGIDVHYAPEGGEPPFQAPALFGSRAGLAATLRELGHKNEADIITSDFKEDYCFLVENTPDLVKAFGFDEVGRVIR